MIEEVVNSILDAEDEAKRRIERAEVKAGEIVAHAETQAEALKRQASASNKQYQAQALTQADVEAEHQAEALVTQLNAQTDGEISKLEKRIDKAVKVILESI